MILVDPRVVAEIIRETAQEIILPRFRHLAAGDIREKGPGDLVTIADTEAEQALTRRLGALLPGSQVVGEEAASADASVLDRLNGKAPVWIIDPVDGTSNFAHGRKHFAVIVALVAEGRTVQGWIHDPLNDSTAIAAVGEGVWIGGRRLSVPAEAPPVKSLTGTVGGRKVEPLAKAVGKLIRHGSAAHDYLALIDGRLHFAYFRRLRPWDHAAGVLMHAEAGGYSAMMDGTPYRPLFTDASILLTPDRQTWDALAGLLA